MVPEFSSGRTPISFPETLYRRSVLGWRRQSHPGYRSTSEELIRRQDLEVVGVDEAVEATENMTKEGPGRVHGLAPDIDPPRLPLVSRRRASRHAWHRSLNPGPRSRRPAGKPGAATAHVRPAT